MPADFTVTDPDGIANVVFHWPAAGTSRAALHVMHGWGEHAQRYDRVATHLAGAGFDVYADDHRGHGQTGARSDMLGDLGPRTTEGALDACYAVTTDVRRRHPGVPLFVLGHSWGSFLLQRILREHANEIDGAIMTGTTHLATVVPPADFNAAFAPARTNYDWLSRDDAEVDRYIADPHCGFEMMQPTTVLDPFPLMEGDDDAIPKSLPLLIANGSVDPIGGEAGGRALAEHYRSLGMTDVTLLVYPDARHELFNEANRGEVEADILAWLDARVSRPTPS